MSATEQDINTPIQPLAASQASQLRFMQRASHGARVFFENWGFALLLAACGFAAWEVAVRVWAVPDWLLPPVSQILVEWWDKKAWLLSHGFVTAQEIMVGFLITGAFGLTLSTVMFWSRILERSIYPFLIASQTIPVFTLAPMLIIWAGTGIAPKVIIIVLFTIFPITISLSTGFRSVDADMVAMFRTLGASRAQMFTKLYLPSALPHLFAGLKVAAVVSVIGAVIGEWIGAGSGLGFVIKNAGARNQTDTAFAAIFTLSAMAALMFLLIVAIQARALRNYPGGSGN